MSKTISILLSLMFAFLSLGCPQKTQKDPRLLSVAVSTAPEALDPRFTGTAVATNLAGLLHAPLFYIGDNLLPEPLLADELIKLSDTSYELRLKPNLRFQDGSFLTAEDVAFTFMTLGSDAVKSPKAEDLQYIKSAEVINPLQVRFTLSLPNAFFPTDIAGIGIVSKKYCENQTDKCKEHPLASGPFFLKSHNKAKESYVFAANPYWFEGKPKVDLLIRVVRDDTTRLLELIDKKTDISVSNINALQLEVIKARYPYLHVLKKAGLGYAYLAMNLRGPKASEPANSEQNRTRRALANPLVRQAIGHAIDIDTIIKTKLRGLAVQASGMIPPGHWAKDEVLRPISYDPAKAKKLLDQAGFNDRSHGKGRFQVELRASPNRFRQSLTLIIASQLQAIGINTTMRIQDFPSLFQDMKQGNFEIFSAIWVPVVDPNLLTWVFHSKNIPGPNGAGGNRGAYIDPIIDAWLDQSQVECNQAKRALIVHNIEHRLQEQMPYVPLWFEDEIAVFNEDVKGFVQYRTGSLLGLRFIQLQRPKEAK